MKTILITGFDPFGGETINPAWEAVKTMDGYTDGDYKVVTQMVPTVRYKSVDTVKAAAEQCQPDFILCVGQAGCLLYTSPSPRDMRRSRMPSSA